MAGHVLDNPVLELPGFVGYPADDECWNKSTFLAELKGMSLVLTKAGHTFSFHCSVIWSDIYQIIIMVII